MSRIAQNLSAIVARIPDGLSTRDVKYAVINWNEESFPRALERAVRLWMRELGDDRRYAKLAAEYAEQDVQASRYLVDPPVDAQDVMLRHKDAADLDRLLRNCHKYSAISDSLARKIASSLRDGSMALRQAKALYNADSKKPEGLVKALERFLKANGVEVDGATRQRRPRQEQAAEKPARQPRQSRRQQAESDDDAGAVRSARRPRPAQEAAEPARRPRRNAEEQRPARAERRPRPAREAADDTDFDFEDGPAQTRQPRRPRQAVQPGRVARPRQPAAEEQLPRARRGTPVDVDQAAASARQVRRPRT